MLFIITNILCDNFLLSFKRKGNAFIFNIYSCLFRTGIVSPWIQLQGKQSKHWIQHTHTVLFC